MLEMLATMLLNKYFISADVGRVIHVGKLLDNIFFFFCFRWRWEIVAQHFQHKLWTRLNKNNVSKKKNISQEIFVDAERRLFSNIVAQRFHRCGPGFTRELCTFFCAKEEIHNLNEKFGSDSLTLEWVQEGT